MKNQIRKIVTMIIVCVPLVCTLLSCGKKNASVAPSASQAESESMSSIKTKSLYKVMPLGDSITAGWCAGSSEHQFGGYRIYLTANLEANGYAENFDFVGKWNTGEGYDMDNSGTNGACIAKDQDWANSVQTDVNEGILKTYDPDLVLLQIGTNDICSQDETDEQLQIETIGNRLETLVDTILSELDEEKVLFLASIPYMQGNSSKYNTDVDNYNSIIKRLAGRKATEGKNVIFVDVNSVVGSDQFDDDLHPNQSGYESIGNLWYEVLTGYFANPEDYLKTALENTSALYNPSNDNNSNK